MKKLLVVVICILFSHSFSFAQETDANVKSKISEYGDRYEQAMMNNDVNAILELHADNAIVLPSYEGIQKGKEQLRTLWQKDIESGNKVTNFEITTTDIQQEGNVIIEIGTYNVAIDMKDSDQPFNDTGKYLTIWEKQGNDWKIAYDIWNTDRNPWENMNHQDREAPQDNE